MREYTRSMGMFNVPIRISNLNGGGEEEFDALVDTGAYLTMAPESALRRLGLEPTRTAEFELADGTVVQYGVTDARTAINGRDAVSPVVFGSEGVEAVIGALTLQALLLAVDPVNEVLMPTRRRPRL